MVGLTDSFDKFLRSALESPVYSNILLLGAGLDPRRLSEAAPIDDEEPPSPPTNVQAEPFLKALAVSWDTPRPKDHVASSVVSLTPVEGGDEVLVTSDEKWGHTVQDLDYVDYEIKVKFIDLWDHESDWSIPIVAKPKESAEYLINLQKAQQAGRLAGLIPSINNASLLADIENYNENLIKQVAMAQPDSSNLLPMNEVDFEQWAAGTVWPPTDTNVSGVAYINAEVPTQYSASVIARQGMNWLALTKNTATTESVRPHRWGIRGTYAGGSEEYIMSVFVDGATGTSVQLQVWASASPSGTSPSLLQSTPVVELDSSDGGQRLFVKFSIPADKPYITYRFNNNISGQTSYWTRLQLERATLKIEPSAWTAGVITTGVIGARAIAAMDASAVNAIFKNAAIESAKIKDIQADKITAGTLQAVNIDVGANLTLVGAGKVQAEHTTLDRQGLTLAHAGSYTTSTIDRSYKISDVPIAGKDHLSIAFWSDPSLYGIMLRADGDVAGKDGMIALHTTEGGVLYQTWTGHIEIIPAIPESQILMGHNVQIAGKLVVGGNIAANGNMSADNFFVQKGNTTYTLTGAYNAANHAHPFVPWDGTGYIRNLYVFLDGAYRIVQRKSNGLLWA